MKVGLFSDIHLHKHLPFSRNGGVDRLEHGLNVLEYIFNYFFEQKCKAIFFLGDFFHTRRTIDIQTLSMTVAKLGEIRQANYDNWEPASLYAIPGNHDSYRDGTGETSIDILKEFGFNVVYGSGFIRMGDPKATFAFVPWMDNAAQLSAIKRLADATPSEMTTKKHYKVLLSHGIPEQFESPTGHVFEDGISRTLLHKFHSCFFGDIHKPQQKWNVTMLGAPMHHDFGDAGGERGCWIFDTVSKLAEFHVIKGIAPEFRNVSSQDAIDDFNYFRLVSTSPIREDVQQRGNVEVVQIIEPEVVKARTELTPDMGAQDVVRKYVRRYGKGFDRDRLIALGTEFLA